MGCIRDRSPNLPVPKQTHLNLAQPLAQHSWDVANIKNHSPHFTGEETKGTLLSWGSGVQLIHLDFQN